MQDSSYSSCTQRFNWTGTISVFLNDEKLNKDKSNSYSYVGIATLKGEALAETAYNVALVVTSACPLKLRISKNKIIK